MISVIIPSYRNPKYLDFCLQSMENTQTNKNEAVVIIDGFVDMYEELVKKWNERSWVRFYKLPENRGLAYALNAGVMFASNKNILIVNEDNVFSYAWDEVLESYSDYLKPETNTVFSLNQIEPTPSIFRYHHKDFGEIDNFKFTEYAVWEKEEREKMPPFTLDGSTLPLFMSKRLYMSVGGWDELYASPFVVDLDFYVKLQLVGAKMRKLTKLAFYHFGSRSTKKREGAEINGGWSEGEQQAAEVFWVKWGFNPKRGEHNEIIIENNRGL